MVSLNKCLKLFDDGFSLVTVSNDKVPNYSWKKNQDKPLSKEEFSKRYNYRGGYYYYSKQQEKKIELRPTEHVGIITGYDFLEVVDVDLKVFSTAREQREWWNEFESYLDDNILDFHEKFTITKTRNNGYHILFKTKRVQGNQKLAKLKGHQECIIETRGVGGYVFIYDKFLNEKNYQDIQFISDEDREILMTICRDYDYKEPEKEHVPKQDKNKYQTKKGEITPWDDFNNKNSVWDIVQSDFKLVRNLKDRLVIKRIGAESTHSGYIFKDNDLMYLHSSGTIYDSEKQYSAWAAHVRKNYNDNFSLAAKEAYKQGYGSRVVIKEIPKFEPININKKTLEFPIDIFPDDIQNFIIQANETLNNSIEYMCCSLLWAVSLSIGNAIKVEIVPGWTENSTVWIALVGEPGWGKTPSIKRIISPLQKLNSREVKRYYNDLEKFEFYDSLSKKEKKDYPEVFKPSKKQFIANDITLEALVDLHQESDNSVGVFKDELAGWFKDMNKYREGSDLEFWLSAWSGSPVILTRVTRKGSYIDKPSIPVLGGIQPSVLNNFNTDENKENGFMDRILLCYPDLKSEYLSKKRMDYESISWFNDVLVKFYEVVKSNVLKHNKEGEIEPLKAVFSEEAFEVYDKRHKEITDTENDDEVNQYLKSMLPKQKAYIARFALLIHFFNGFFDSDDGATIEISKSSVLKAIKLSDYFIENAKKVKSDSMEVNLAKKIFSDNRNKSNKQKALAIIKEIPSINKSKLADLLGVSRQTIYNYLK